MNRIDEHHGLVAAHRVEQVLTSVDEGRLYGVVQARQ